MTDPLALSPKTAAALADAVYGIKDTANLERALFERRQSAMLADGRFDFSNAVRVGGSSGAGIRSTTGFSLVIPCKGSLQGQYVVATRGTVSIYDWMSDFAAAMEPGPSGCSVHAGFNRVAKSVLPSVIGALRNKNPSRVHVVGHSLGGAVSNIIAASLSEAFGMCGGVDLYTFGAPRAGRYRKVLDSDALEFGGSGYSQASEVEAHAEPWREFPARIQIDLPPLSMTVWEAVI